MWHYHITTILSFSNLVVDGLLKEFRAKSSSWSENYRVRQPDADYQDKNIAVITDQDNNGSLWSRIVRLNNFPKSPWVPIHWPPDPLITLTYASEQRHKTPHCTHKSSNPGFNKSMKVSTRGFTEDLQSKKQFRLWTRSVSAQQLTVQTQVTQMIWANMGVTLSHLIYIKSGLVCRNGTMELQKDMKDEVSIQKICTKSRHIHGSIVE